MIIFIFCLSLYENRLSSSISSIGSQTSSKGRYSMNFNISEIHCRVVLFEWVRYIASTRNGKSVSLSLDGHVSLETRYYISSLPTETKRFATAARGHWAVENSLH
jgi:hypothetical protein